MKILHVIEILDPKQGGPPSVAVSLAAAQSNLGHEVAILSYGAAVGSAPVLHEQFARVPGIESVKLFQTLPEYGVASVAAKRGWELARKHVPNADVVHIHGVWEPILRVSSLIARQYGVPYVVRPAGMLDPWSLDQKKIKKAIALFAGYKSMLNGAAFIHALNRDERDMIGPLGLTVPCRVYPNGIFPEDVGLVTDKNEYRRTVPVLGENPYVLFLSRLHSKKGLDYLADAFGMLAPAHPNLQLVVAGPKGGAEGRFMEAITRLRLGGRVHMVGPLFGRTKLAAMSGAVAFCLPSRQEGFPVAVIEALASGAPAVISTACHFPEVATAGPEGAAGVGAGRVVPLDPRAIREALHAIISDPEMARKMSANGQQLIREHYTWATVASGCITAYEEVRAKAVRPAAGHGMRILHVVRSLDPAAGGVPVIALKLAAAQAALGHKTGMLTYRVPSAEKDIAAMISEVPGGTLVDQHYLPAEGMIERLTGKAAAAMSRSLVPQLDYVHLHGMWEPQLWRVAAACRQAGVPYVVTPHGMLDPWSLAQSPLKKRVALSVVVRRMLDGASFLHLGNRDERELIESLGLRTQSELIPNGVFPDELADPPVAGTFRALRPELGHAPYILFLSRLHYKKGLDYLSEAFAIVAKRFPELLLVVAGPDGGAKAEFDQAISAAGLKNRVHLVGPLYGRTKIAAVVDAAVFCLPSRQEGFSMAITEALGLGCPCVVTKPCHFPEVEDYGAGFVVDLDGKSVAEGLIKVLSDSTARERMGHAGSQLVSTRYVWPEIARLTVECYLRHPAEVAGGVAGATRVVA